MLKNSTSCQEAACGMPTAMPSSDMSSVHGGVIAWNCKIPATTLELLPALISESHQ